MTHYEYKVVPTSTRPPRIKGVRDASERMRRAYEDLLNGLASQGWEYVRRDLVTVEARSGFLRRKEVRDDVVLIFRRAQGIPLSAQAADDDRAFAPEIQDRFDDPLPDPHGLEDEAGAESPARTELRGERPTGAQPLFARRIEAAREALRTRADPPLSARRDDREP